jgi:membrane dipeptidase
MWVDIAHLADAGVSDILQMTEGPVMASHANARQIHAHPRNLTDDVISELIRRKGWMGLTFEASFVAKGTVGIEDVFRHVDHVLALGGESLLGFGSDFDGTDTSVVGLSSADHYRRFSELVMYRYGDAVGQKLLFDNFEAYLERQLPL